MYIHPYREFRYFFPGFIPAFVSVSEWGKDVQALSGSVGLKFRQLI